MLESKCFKLNLKVKQLNIKHQLSIDMMVVWKSYMTSHNVMAYQFKCHTDHIYDLFFSDVQNRHYNLFLLHPSSLSHGEVTIKIELDFIYCLIGPFFQACSRQLLYNQMSTDFLMAMDLILYNKAITKVKIEVYTW